MEEAELKTEAELKIKVQQPSRRQFSLRGMLRTVSCVCVLSAIPGFWPAALALGIALALFMLPGLGILLMLMLAQASVYAAWQRAAVRRAPSRNSAGQNEDAHFCAQIIQRR